MVAATRAIVVIGITFASISCGNPSSPTPGPVAAGKWGGDGIDITVMSNGGTVRFCCASGTIDQPLVADASGRFDSSGTYTYEGGPVRVNGNPTVPAQYVGTLEGSSMILRVSIASETLGPFTLRLGQPGILQYCVCPV